MSSIRLKSTDDEVLESSVNKNHLGRLFKYLAPYKVQVFGAIITMFIAAAANLVSPLILRSALDNNIAIGKFEGLPLLAIAIIGLSIISAIGTKYKILLMNVTGRRALATVRKDLFDHVQTLGFDFFDSRPAGKIMVRIINDVNSLLNLFNNGLVNSLTNIVKLFIIAGLMIWLDWRLALIGFGTLPFLFAILFGLRPYIRRNWRKVRRKISNMNGYLQEALSGIKVTQAYVREDENIKIFKETNDDIKSSWIAGMKLNKLFGSSFEIVSVIGTALIYLFGIKMMYPHDGIDAITLGTLMSMTWYLSRFWQPLNELSNLYTQILVAMASLERINEILDYTASVKDNEKRIPLKDIKGDVEFENVTFGYEEGQTVLDNISFKANAGQSIAFVGPTGAGKSTIINLVSRFYDVREGVIRIDGNDIKDYKLSDIRDRIGVVLQETFIFSGTIIENIRYGKLDATDEEVMAAAKAVHAHDFIQKMERGYYTEVNERGSRLSMGQRQLISFARTLLSDPDVLILDEATASIDTKTEILVQQAIDILLKGRTSFLIAHRLSTIRKADCIMVIVDGKIAEQGDHDDLIRQEGHYYKLCDAQYKHMQV